MAGRGEWISPRRGGSRPSPSEVLPVALNIWPCSKRWTASSPCLVALAISALLTPIVWRLARALGALDHPTDRSVSYRPNIPLSGGLAVAAGFGAGLLLALWLSGVRPAPSHLGGMLLGGARDPGPRDVGRPLWAAAHDEVRGADRGGSDRLPRRLSDRPPHRAVHPDDLRLRRAAVWVASGLSIVGVTNAVNLIDGLDGLRRAWGPSSAPRSPSSCFRADRRWACSSEWRCWGG